MAFANFTGSSRKPRQVNLSGQRQPAQNPFAAWGANGPSPSSAVLDAQAQRGRRHLERERVKATQRIQRVWRGHRTRTALQTIRRQETDQLYGGVAAMIGIASTASTASTASASRTADETESSHQLEQRALRAVPLILVVFNPLRPDDCMRLACVADDLVRLRFSIFATGSIPLSRLNKLSRIFLSALQRIPVAQTPQVRILWAALAIIVDSNIQALEQNWDQYYHMLGHYCGQTHLDSDVEVYVRNCLIAPLKYDKKVYRNLVFSFLSQPDLVLIERDMGAFAAEIDVNRLAQAIVTVASEQRGKAQHEKELTWLLAHYIAIQRADKRQNDMTGSLRVLYILLSSVSTRIRDSFNHSTAAAARSSAGKGKVVLLELPSYVSDQVSSLADPEGISGLSAMVASNNIDPDQSNSEVASLLAGYILTLIYCLPSRADDIRMRLYLVDIPTPQGHVPAMSFFWNALSKTSTFALIQCHIECTLSILQDGISRRNGVTNEDTTWHRNWRTVLLFLELYVFILRLTDDEDFFSTHDTAAISVEGPVSRLRSVSLSKQALGSLTLFLKHLGFTLYYSARELLEAAFPKSSPTSLEDVLAKTSGLGPVTQTENAKNSRPSNFVFISGVDFKTFRGLVTTAVRMLNERDSRRPFLPPNHWLLTSEIEMKGFLEAVVLAEQKRQTGTDNGEDEEDGEGEQSSEDDEDMAREVRYSQTTDGQGHSRGARRARIEAMRAQQRKESQEKRFASVEPILQILRNMPFVIPFNIRVQIFRQFVLMDKETRRNGHVDPDQWSMFMLAQHPGPSSPWGRHQAEIQRGRLLEDALDKFWGLGDGLKEPIKITFVDEFGMPEAGIDGGGVTKEFLTSVTKEAFTGEENFFLTNDKNSYYPNPGAFDQVKEALRTAGVAERSDEWGEAISYFFQQWEFLGRIIGKCLYEGILLDISFAGFFLLKWVSTSADTAYKANINDLREMDEGLYQGMLQLKNYPGDVSELALDFTVTDELSRAGVTPVRTATRSLVTHGADMTVTNENRLLYMNYVARHRLVVQPHPHTRTFLRGLHAIIDPAWLGMFNQSDLQWLVSGDDSGIDTEDLRRNTVYSGAYVLEGENHPTMQLFWQVMRELPVEQRRDVLRFVTSTPRGPLLGFEQLRPLFTIRDSGLDTTRLPSASTCVNLLKLPQYRTAEELKEKLLYAVTSKAGFDLS